MSKANPYIGHIEHCVVDCGKLLDTVDAEVTRAIRVGPHAVRQLLRLVKEAHEYWMQGHNLRGLKLRRAGTPFLSAYDHLETWLSQNGQRRRSAS
jgi:hypothetical protein